MGLDTVELVMDVENRFDITVDDRDAEHLATAGQLCDYVVSALRRRLPTSPSACLTAHQFYTVRSEFLREWDVGRGWVRPRTRLSGIIPARHRAAVWSRLSRRLGIHPSPLNRPHRRRLGPTSTVADIVRYQVSRVGEFLVGGRLAEGAVWAAVREIVAEQTGVPLERIHRDDHLIYDLGMS